jgi:shikimate dehydrogenase
VASIYKENKNCFKKLKKILPKYLSVFPANKIQIIKAIEDRGKNLEKITKIIHPEIRKKLSTFLKKNKKALILGAGGVVPSIIIALKKMQIEKIYLSNRTELKAIELKKNFPEIEIIKWGDTLDFDIIINATSIGLKKKDEININYQQISKDKFFYDVIYNPPETNFLKNAKKYGGLAKNGKMMFIYQDQKAFFIWHKVIPKIDSETINLLDI